MAGADCAIDAVGFQARSQKDRDKEDPMQTIRQIAEIVYLRDLISAGKARPSFIVSRPLRSPRGWRRLIEADANAARWRFAVANA
jgi:hypothetical protein